MDCININLKKGSSGTNVHELQIALKDLGFYTAKIDSSFGTYTDTAVKQFQKKYNLKVDGIVGPVTCKKIKSLTTSVTTTGSKSYSKNGVYYSSPHWTSAGCNKLGQCTGYYCAVHSIRQCNSKQDIDSFSEGTLAGYAGTTTRGTSHGGIETAIAKVAKTIGKKISVTWKNFSDLGNTTDERFKKLGEIISKQNTDVILHVLYRNQYGHYETIKQIDTNNRNMVVLNSLGSKCSGTAYCGYLETRSYKTMEQYLRGISQKSICIITYS